MVFWLVIAVVEFAMFRLTQAGTPGWAWTSNPVVDPTDPLAGYSRIWKFYPALRLIGGVGLYSIPFLGLFVSWIRAGIRPEEGEPRGKELRSLDEEQEPPDLQDLRAVLETVVGEMNRYRELPIRVLSFESALLFGAVGILVIGKVEMTSGLAQWVCSGVLAVLWVWTEVYLVKCHLGYLDARGVQTDIQGFLRLNRFEFGGENPVLPREWFVRRPRRISTGFWCIGFYLFYTAVVYGCVLWAIWGAPGLRLV